MVRVWEVLKRNVVGATRAERMLALPCQYKLFSLSSILSWCPNKSSSTCANNNQLRQIIDLLCTDKSWYFAQPRPIIVKVFREKATSALASFYASPLSWSNWNLEMLVFVGGKPENLGKNPRSVGRTNNKLYMAPAEIEPGRPHWWKASTLTSAFIWQYSMNFNDILFDTW